MATGNQLLSEIVLYDKYARWREDLQRRETWPEVVDRVVGFFRSRPEGDVLPENVWTEIRDAMLRKDVLPSMRVVQMAGAPLARCHVGAYNCAYTTLDSPVALAELLYILMQGTGVGYSVERRYIDQWPAVATDPVTPAALTVEDSTEGWCDGFKAVMHNALNGQHTIVDYSRIRPAGAWLHTKGGTASGPEPLNLLLTKTQEILLKDVGLGNRPTPFHIHRLATLCGSIVQVGGVRRAAEICLFDADDATMRACKNGAFWETYPELAMANNSLVATDGAGTAAEILSLFAQLATTGSGEPGLFRRDGRIPDRREPRDDFGTNPCGEIILRPQQFCNLSIAVARVDDTDETLARKVQLATVLGTLQSTLTRFNYLRPIWKVNSEAERLLGVDITGAADCPLLREHGDPHMEIEVANRLNTLQRLAVATNRTMAKQLGIPVSAAVTCNKPSGNSSQLVDCASGIHVRYAPYYIRRIRLGARSPLSARLQALGLPCFPEVGQGTLETASVWVFELPVQSPEGAITRADVSAIDQLHTWLLWKRNWTEHNPSCTIYVRPDEWVDVASFVWQYWDYIGGLSFLPKDDHAYALAPYEEISAAEYQRRAAALPEALNLHTIVESRDLTTVNQEYACVGGICEI